MRQAQAIVVNELRERGEACELVVTAGLSPNYHYDTPSVLRIGELIADAIGRLGIAVDARAGVDHQYSVASAAEVVWRRMAAQSARWSALLGSDAAGASMMERRVFSLGFEEGQGVAVWADGVPRTSAPTGVFASPPDWIDGLHGKAIRIRTDIYTPNQLTLPLPVHDVGDDLSVSVLVQSPLLESSRILGNDKGWFVGLALGGMLGVGLRLRDTVRPSLGARRVP